MDRVLAGRNNDREAVVYKELVYKLATYDRGVEGRVNCRPNDRFTGPGRDNAAWNRTSQPDSLHLAECNLVLCPVVEFRRSRRFVSGHLLGVLEPSVVLQVNGDAGGSPGVTSDGAWENLLFWPVSGWQPRHCTDSKRAPLPSVPAELTLWNRG
jgi:hypothetical protein